MAESSPILLIVEPDVLVRNAVAGYLRECGYTVIEAAAPHEALGVLEDKRPIDVVFSEIHFPAGDGFALAQRIRRDWPKIKIILTSGVRKVAEEAGELCEQGPILAKPYDHRDLERHIRQLLGRSS
jgi:CheY-like chemotaxis protein